MIGERDEQVGVCQSLREVGLSKGLVEWGQSFRFNNIN